MTKKLRQRETEEGKVEAKRCTLDLWGQCDDGRMKMLEGEGAEG